MSLLRQWKQPQARSHPRRTRTAATAPTTKRGEGRQGEEAGATATTVLIVLAWLPVVELGDVRCERPPKPHEATENIVEKLRWHGSIIRDCSWHHYLPTLVSSL
ncbi:hypothetical protein GUJ93_ZPchr0009g1356 [Zizania palustris]|uniref:Uncharacterized protein n=1 Tax=Zizania palustris TaxID=103762 RepID=A0A8J5V4M7_ZIZPA|nr:hypothetical protein GUJ93_ZPchr0009g1356 [Zizania palustris]